MPVVSEPSSDMWIQLAAAAAVALPLGLDLYMPVPEDNPLRADRIALGRQAVLRPSALTRRLGVVRDMPPARTRVCGWSSAAGRR